MFKRSIMVAAGILAAGFPGISGNLSTAEAASDFYKGKTIRVIIRSNPGGGYDFYGRLIARHMPRHIPGNPDAIAVNMPGAGGIVAANYMMNRAKKDGTEIAILTRELPLAQRTGATGVKYDVRKLIPLGSASSSTFLVVLAKDHPVKTIQDLRKHKQEVRLSATGPGSGSYQWASLLKFDGMPVKIISGYTGGQERFLAIVRGEVHGTANSYESTSKAIKEHGFVPILYAGAKRSELEGVPHVDEGLTEKGKQLAALIGAPLQAGRPFFTTPGVPSDRVAILRAAFKAALSDPKLLAEAQRAKRSISWADPADVIAAYNTVLNASDVVVAHYNEGSRKPKKSAIKMVTHEGVVTETKRGGRRITISYKTGEVTAKVSGSRTTVTVGGKKVKRKAVKVGMVCKFTYPKPGAEATNVDCKK